MNEAILKRGWGVFRELEKAYNSLVMLMLDVDEDMDEGDTDSMRALYHFEEVRSDLSDVGGSLKMFLSMEEESEGESVDG